MAEEGRETWWRAAAAVRPPLAEWAPDPSGRHELRWWDGGAWTVLVADWGITNVDPHHNE